MRARIPLAIVLALFVAVSCDQQPVAPVGEQTVAEAPSFDWMNNPDNGNLKVYRDYLDFILCWTDDELPLRACVGNVPLGGGPDPVYTCGLQQTEAPLSYQDVGYFGDPGSDLKAVLKGDVWITVRDVSTSGDCVGVALVGEGWGKLVYTDNDAWGLDEEDHHTNTWKFKSQGQLLTPGGEKIGFSGLRHCEGSADKGLRCFNKVHVN